MERGRVMRQQDPLLSADAPPAGIEAVYLAHRENLLRFLRARGAGPEADDLVQELWLRIMACPMGPVVNPISYLYRAANNLMLNAYRTSARSSARAEAWGEIHTSGEANAAETELVAREEIALAQSRLADCGSRAEEMFILFRVEGMSQRDIAERFQLSVSAVEKNIRRAYRAIAALKDEDRG